MENTCFDIMSMYTCHDTEVMFVSDLHKVNVSWVYTIVSCVLLALSITHVGKHYVTPSGRGNANICHSASKLL